MISAAGKVSASSASGGTGKISNSGTLEAGSLEAQTFENKTGAIYVQNGADGETSVKGALTNSGKIDADGAISVGGTLTNNASGTIEMDGEELSVKKINNYGTVSALNAELSSAEDISSVGSMTVASITGGKALYVGSVGGGNKTSAAELVVSGNVNVASGIFDNYGSVSVGGDLTAKGVTNHYSDKAGEIDVAGTLVSNGNVSNYGNISAKSADITGVLNTGSADRKGAQFTVTDDLTVSGKITNEGTLSAGNVTAKADFENKADSTVNAGSLTVTKTVVNRGTLNADELTASGKITNENKLSAGSVTAKDSFENKAGATAELTGGLSVGKTLTNSGTLEAESVSANALNNNAAATLRAEKSVETTDKLVNNGTVSAESVNAGNGLDNSGSASKIELTGDLAVTGNVSNSGSITAAGLSTSGKFDNKADASVVLTGDASVGGTLTNSGSFTAKTLTAGTLENKSTGTLTLTDGTLTVDILKNSGTLVFNKADDLRITHVSDPNNPDGVYSVNSGIIRFTDADSGPLKVQSWLMVNDGGNIENLDTLEVMKLNVQGGNLTGVKNIVTTGGTEGMSINEINGGLIEADNVTTGWGMWTTNSDLTVRDTLKVDYSVEIANASTAILHNVYGPELEQKLLSGQTAGDHKAVTTIDGESVLNNMLVRYGTLTNDGDMTVTPDKDLSAYGIENKYTTNTLKFGDLGTVWVRGDALYVNNGTGEYKNVTLGYKYSWWDALLGGDSVSSAGHMQLNGTESASGLLKIIQGSDLVISDTGSGSYHDISLSDTNSRIVNSGKLKSDGTAAVNSGAYILNENSAEYGKLVVNAGGRVQDDKSDKGVSAQVMGSYLVSEDATSEWTDMATSGRGVTDNKGILSVAGTASVADSGLMKTEAGAESSFNNMKVTGGTVTNAGKETGTGTFTMTGGSYGNTGTSEWNTVSMSGGQAVNDGDASWKTVTVSGNGVLGNNGTFTSEDSVTVSGSGKLIASEGSKSSYKDLTVKGGTASNSGTETGTGVLTVSGGVYGNTETGTSTWNEANVSGGQAVNDGEASWKTVAVSGNGVLGNNGTFASEDSVTVSGSGKLIASEGSKSSYKDLTVEGGAVSNAGTEKGSGIFAISGGSYANGGTSSWGEIRQSGGAAENSGTAEWADAQMTGGALLNSGNMKSDSFGMDAADGTAAFLNTRTFSARKLTVSGAGSQMQSTGTVTASEAKVLDGSRFDTAGSGRTEIGTLDTVSGGLGVFDSGVLLIGRNAAALYDYAAPLGGGNGAGVALTEQVKISSGSLSVGGDPALRLPDGSLVFGSGSSLMVPLNTLSTATNAAIIGENKGTLTVEPGARVILTGLANPGKYMITDGFDTTKTNNIGALTGDTMANASNWNGGWTEGALIVDPRTDKFGLQWDVSLFFNANQTWINVVRGKAPDVIIPDVVRDSLDNGEPVFSDILLSPNSGAERAEIINSAAHLGALSGATTLAIGGAQEAMGLIDNRISFKEEMFNQDGFLIRESDGKNAWADVFGGSRRQGGLSATGGYRLGTKARDTGVIAGIDTMREEKDHIFGIGFSYLEGNADSTGDLLLTKTDYNQIGLHGYWAWVPNDRFNVVNHIAYFRAHADANQPLGKNTGYSALRADIDQNIWMWDLRSEYRQPLSSWSSLIPHAGLNGTLMPAHWYETKADGHVFMRSKVGTAHSWVIPVGAALRMQRSDWNGWNVRAHGDVSLLVRLNEREQSTKVESLGRMNNTIYSNFTGKYAWQTKFALEADRGPFTFGASYLRTEGAGSQKDHRYQVSARYRW